MKSFILLIPSLLGNLSSYNYTPVLTPTVDSLIFLVTNIRQIISIDTDITGNAQLFSMHKQSTTLLEFRDFKTFSWILPRPQISRLSRGHAPKLKTIHTYPFLEEGEWKTTEFI